MRKYVAFFMLVAPCFFTAVANVTCWPFSSYDMYSRPWERTAVRSYELIGYSADGKSFEIQQKHTAPLSHPCWVDKFDWIAARRPQDLDQALRYILNNCNKIESAKNHSWPALTAIQIREVIQSYDENWNLLGERTKVLHEHKVSFTQGL